MRVMVLVVGDKEKDILCIYTPHQLGFVVSWLTFDDMIV